MSHWAQGGPPGPPAVGTTVVQPQSITETDEFVGRIQATNRVDLVARVTGFLTKRLFTEGVRGQARRPAVPDRESRRSRRMSPAKMAAVAQANAQLQNASITLGRANSLLNTPAGQRSTVDDATARQRSQAAMLLAAQANLQTSADQPRLHRHHRTRSAGKIAPDQRHGRQRGGAVHRHAWRPSSARTRCTCCSRSRCAARWSLRDRYADKGGTAAVIIKLKLPTGKTYEPGRPHRLHRPDRRRPTRTR